MRKIQDWLQNSKPVKTDLIGRRRIVVKNIFKWVGVFFGALLLIGGVLPALFSSTGGAQVTEEKELTLSEEDKSLLEEAAQKLKRAQDTLVHPPKEVSQSSQVIRREGASFALPPGTKIQGIIRNNVIAALSPAPVNIEVQRVELPNGAQRFPPNGSTIVAEAIYSDETKRALIVPKHLVLRGREVLSLNGRSESMDGTYGVSGKIRRDKLKNLSGVYLSYFLSGASQGAMNQGLFGQSEIKNPWTNAVISGFGEVARHEGQRLAHEMQKEVTLIEISAGTPLMIRLDQPLDWNW